MSDYLIRKLNADEFHLLVPIMYDCFGLKVDIRYFEWKFLNNPSGAFVGFVAVAPNGEIAAYYGAIPARFIVNGKELTIYQSCDTMTHSRHRRQGLFQKLALHCYDFLRQQDKLFVFGFGGGQSTPGFIKFGWAHLFDMRSYFYPRLFARFYLHGQNKQIIEITDFARIENAILNSNCFAHIHSHKTLEIFKWRIANPNFKYTVIGFESADGKVNSYLCYYFHDDKIILFDFGFENTAVAKKLTGYLKSLLRRSNCKGIVAFCQEASYFSKVLRKQHFTTNPFQRGPLAHRTPFIYFASPQVMASANNPLRWQVSSFDHDAM